MSSQADFDFGNAIVELDLAPLDVVRDALRTLKESKRQDDSLERILLEKRVITYEQAALARRRIKGSQPSGAPEIPGYQILDVLGSGGAGTVYRARQVSMDRIVAIKVLSARLAKDQAYLDRFFREARAAARLSHPNLIIAHDVGAHEGSYYLVMEYVSGATLQQLLDSQGTLEESRVIDVAIQVAKALEVAHRNGLVHRDVKPANILLSSDGQAKLFDLGLAREGVAASEGRAVGTPRYISPEQAKDSPQIDIRSDLYSLGATMYHLVTGQLPFTAETTAQMLAKHVAERLVPAHVRNPRVSQELSAVISRLMEKSPDNRIQRPQDLVGALESIRSRRGRQAPKAAAVITAPAPMPRRVAMPAPVAYRRDHRGGGGRFLLIAVVFGVAAAAWFYRDRIFAAVETKDITKLTNTGPTEEEKAAAEEASRRELSEIEASAKADAGFAALDSVLERFEDYRRRHRGTAWDTAAMDKRKEYLDRADVVADGELRRIRERAGELLAAGKDREVHELYGRFPKRFLDTTPTGQVVKEELRELGGRITEKFTRDKQQLQERLRERRYEEALAMLAAMEEYALPDQLLELAERRRALEGLRKVGENSAAAVEVRDKYLLLDGGLRDAFANKNFKDAIKALSEFLYGAWSEAEKPFVRVEGVDYDALKKELDAPAPAYDKILARIEAGMGDPANLAEATTAESILLDLRNAVSLELFKARVAEGIDRTTKAVPREHWVATGLGNKRGHFEKRENALFWVPEGLKAFQVDPWLRLSEVDLVGLAARSYGLERPAAEAAALADPVFHLRAGLLHNFARTGTVGAAHAERHFKEAAKGGVKGVKVYLSDLTETLQKLAEQDAAQRFAEAKGLLAQGQATTARKVLEELASRTGKVKFVEEHKAEIDKMLADIRETLLKGKKYEESFRAKVEPVDEKRVRVFYDFTDRGQGEMFELVTLDNKLKGRWKVEGGVFEAQKGTSVSSASRWKPLINGDVEVEYDLVSMEDPQNIATDLYYKPGSDKYYGVTFGIDLVVGNMEEIMQIPNTAVVKYPTDFQPARAKMPNEWEKFRTCIIGGAVSDFRLEKKKKVHVKIERIGKALTLAVDGKPVWQAEDIDYRTGHLLFFSDCRAQIDNLAITFAP